MYDEIHDLPNTKDRKACWLSVQYADEIREKDLHILHWTTPSGIYLTEYV